MLLVFETIVPVAFPKVYVSVWVKLLDARLMLIVPALPKLVAGIEQEDFRGIVYSDTDCQPSVQKPFAPFPSVV